MLITVNGKRIEPASVGLSPLDRGFLFGDGIFETIRIYSGTAFRLHAHLERMHSAADRLDIELRPNIESLVLHEIERALGAGIRDGFLRITATRGDGFGLGHNPQKSTLVTFIDSLPFLNPSWYSEGMSVVTAAARRNEFAASAGIKTTAYLESIVAFRASALAGADDAVFLDTQGHLSEATASNLFLVEGSTLYTAPVQCGALPGITRAAVLEIAESANLSVVSDTPLHPSRIQRASEFFLTSSIREIVPVVSQDGCKIGKGLPGPVTRKIMSAYSEMTHCKS